MKKHMSRLLINWPIFAIFGLVPFTTWPLVQALMVGEKWKSGLFMIGMVIVIGMLLHPPRLLLKLLNNPYIFFVIGLGWVMEGAIFSSGIAICRSLAVALVFMALRYCLVGTGAINRWIIVVFLNLGMWILPGEGGMAVWGVLVFACVILLSHPRLDDWLVIVISILLGGLAGASEVFFWLPLLVAGSLLAVWPGRALVVACVGGVCCYLSSMWLGNGMGEWPFSGMEESVAAGIFMGISCMTMVYHWRWWSPVWQLAWGLGVVALVWDSAALVEGSTGYQGYMTAALPVLMFALLGVLGHQKRIKNL